MLNGIHLVDFGNHRNTRLTFGPMTALVGQNGSGKTTVMRAIGEISRLCSDPKRHAAIDDAFYRIGRDEIMIATAWPGAFKGSQGYWGVVINEYIEGSASETWEWRTASSDGRRWIPEYDLEGTNPVLDDTPTKQVLKSEPGTVFRLSESSPEIRRMRFWRCRYFKTSASSLQRAAIADPKETVLNTDGSNLAWALSSLMTEHPDRFQSILEALQEVVPLVKGIRSRAVSLKQTVKQTITINRRDRTFDEERDVNGQELIFDMKSGKGLPAASVSEGTLVALAVLTLVYGSDAELIMLDDVELGLHPKAQRDLIRQLRRIQETHPKLQILISTHSPYVVDEFKAEDVWVFAPDKDGCAVTKRLSYHPDAKRALDVLTTGEFWSAKGEPWVLDEEPTARVAEEPNA